MSRLEAMVGDLADRSLDQSPELLKSADLDIVARDTVPLMSMFDNALVRLHPGRLRAWAVPGVAIGCRT
jgi:hypothetical protein